LYLDVFFRPIFYLNLIKYTSPVVLKHVLVSSIIVINCANKTDFMTIIADSFILLENIGTNHRYAQRTSTVHSDDIHVMNLFDNGATTS
jgi:hypothetical protein